MNTRASASYIGEVPGTVDEIMIAKSDAGIAWGRVVRLWRNPFSRHETRVRVVREYEAAVRAVGALVHSRAVGEHGAHSAAIPGGGRHYALRADAYRATLAEIGVPSGGERLLTQELSREELADFRQAAADSVSADYRNLLDGVKDVMREVVYRYSMDDLRARHEVQDAAAQMPTAWVYLSNDDTMPPLYVRSTLARPFTTRPRAGGTFRKALGAPVLKVDGRLPTRRDFPADPTIPNHRRGERWWRDPHPVSHHEDLHHDGHASRALTTGGSVDHRSIIHTNGWFGDLSRAVIARPSALLWRVNASHEFAHRVERLDARVFLATNAFLDRRSGPNLRVIDPSTSEIGREGAFIDPYTGKDSGTAEGTEVFSTGVEALWFGNYGGFEGVSMRDGSHLRDDEHRDLILGLFATATFDRSTRVMRKARVPRWL